MKESKFNGITAPAVIRIDLDARVIIVKRIFFVDLLKVVQLHSYNASPTFVL